MNVEYAYNSSLSAHYKIPGGKRVCLLGAQLNADGSITGTAPGYDNGFTSAPDRVVTLSATMVRKLRVRMVAR